MAEQWDPTDLVLGALAAELSERLDGVLTVEIGWVGSTPLTSARNQALFLLEAGTPQRELAAAVIQSTTPPEDYEVSAQGSAVYDYGRAKIMITGNLYVWSDRRGKTRRTLLSRAVEQAFDLVEGEPPHIRLTLDDGLGTIAYIVLDDINHRDEPEGLKANEWRSIFRLQATCPLRAERSQSFCRDIVLENANTGEQTSVAGVVEDSPT